MGTITVTSTVKNLYETRAERLRGQGASLHVDREAELVVFVKEKTAIMFEGNIAVNMLDQVPSNVAAEDYLLSLLGGS